MNDFATRLLLLLSSVVLLSGCASGYQEFYKPRPGSSPEAIAAMRAAPPPPMPVVERSKPIDSTTVVDAYAKRGYVVIGTSFFNSGRTEAEEPALLQGKLIEADLVLILNPRYTGSVTTSIPITTPTSTTSYSSGSATAFGPGGPVTAYGSGTTTTRGTTTNYMPVTVNRSDYGAVYFRRVSRGLSPHSRC